MDEHHGGLGILRTMDEHVPRQRIRGSGQGDRIKRGSDFFRKLIIPHFEERGKGGAAHQTGPSDYTE